MLPVGNGLLAPALHLDTLRARCSVVRLHLPIGKEQALPAVRRKDQVDQFQADGSSSPAKRAAGNCAA